MHALFRSVVLTLVLFAICGVAYPIAGWALSQAVLHSQANGSIIRDGSTLIGQPWNNGTSINPLWFNGRPDAYIPLMLQLPGGKVVSGSSGASNLGPRSKVLAGAVTALVAEWKAVGVTNPTPDLVTSSGSGIDPDITPADALVQVPMIARARRLAPSTLRALIARETVGPQFGFLGSSYVNVLALNEALAALIP